MAPFFFAFFSVQRLVGGYNVFTLGNHFNVLIKTDAIKGQYNMPTTKNQSTKRFNFSVTRDPKSHKAGSNTLVISTLPSEGSKYSTGTTSVTMSVKEARVLQGFLNNQFTNPIAD